MALLYSPTTSLRDLANSPAVLLGTNCSITYLVLLDIITKNDNPDINSTSATSITYLFSYICCAGTWVCSDRIASGWPMVNFPLIQGRDGPNIIQAFAISLVMIGASLNRDVLLVQLTSFLKAISLGFPCMACIFVPGLPSPLLHGCTCQNFHGCSAPS